MTPRTPWRHRRPGPRRQAAAGHRRRHRGAGRAAPWQGRAHRAARPARRSADRRRPLRRRRARRRGHAGAGRRHARAEDPRADAPGRGADAPEPEQARARRGRAGAGPGRGRPRPGHGGRQRAVPGRGAAARRCSTTPRWPARSARPRCSKPWATPPCTGRAHWLTAFAHTRLSRNDASRAPRCRRWLWRGRRATPTAWPMR